MKAINNVITPVNIDARKGLELRSGDTVRVHQKIEEKGKTRIQMFEGIVLAVKHGGQAGGTFTVRRVASGVGVEKIFPLFSPMIEKIEIVRRARMRRAKLYHIRHKAAKEIRRAMRNLKDVFVTDESTPEPEVEEEKKSEAAPTEEVKSEEVPKEEQAETPEEPKT